MQNVLTVWDAYDYVVDMACFATLNELGPLIASAALIADPVLQGVVWC